MPRFRRIKKTARRKSRTRVSPHALFSRRLTALTVVFVAICITYAGILISLQARGNAYAIYVDGPAVPDGGSVQTVTVQAVRGGIYDRNGKPLVTNRYSYDLTLDYSSLRDAGSVHTRNRLLLSLLSSLQNDATATLYADRFPLVGDYPNLRYSESARDPDSPVYASLLRVLGRIELPENASASALVSYYVDTYSLGAHTDGVPTYTGAEITALIALYYDMDECGFGVSSPYAMAGEVSSTFIASQKENATPGVRFTLRAERVNHYPGYATHILGRVGQIFAEDWEYYSAMGYPMNAIVGTSGAESAFEAILHGTDGQMQITLDANGRTVEQTTIKQPIAGQDIRLTIDIDAQIAAEDALRQGGTPGSVVAMADNGELLVLASYPSYDAATFNANYDVLSTDPDLPLLNRALSATYIPGDIMQLLSATAGLCERTISSYDELTDGGKLTVGEGSILCPQYLEKGHSHTALNVSSALEERCAVFFGQLGLRLGNQTFSRYEGLLGIGLATGIELAESVGKSANIYPGIPTEPAFAAVGQSDCRMTPAQMCAMLSTVASGGNRYASHLLLEVRDYTSGTVVYRKNAELLSQFTMSELDRRTVLRALKNEVVFDSALSQLTADVRASGVEVGCFDTLAPSGLAGQNNAVVLMHADPTNTGKLTVSVAVVVEKQTDTSPACTVAGTLLSALYH